LAIKLEWYNINSSVGLRQKFCWKIARNCSGQIQSFGRCALQIYPFARLALLRLGKSLKSACTYWAMSKWHELFYSILVVDQASCLEVASSKICSIWYGRSSFGSRARLSAPPVDNWHISTSPSTILNDPNTACGVVEDGDGVVEARTVAAAAVAAWLKRGWQRRGWNEDDGGSGGVVEERQARETWESWWRKMRRRSCYTNPIVYGVMGLGKLAAHQITWHLLCSLGWRGPACTGSIFFSSDDAVASLKKVPSIYHTVACPNPSFKLKCWVPYLKCSRISWTCYGSVIFFYHTEVHKQRRGWIDSYGSQHRHVY
jgi:hypothetical protein